MKNLIKFSGLFLVFIAVLILILEVKSGINNNTYLVLSGSLIIVGLILHVVLNKKMM
jgi:hypothetical protein